MEPKTKQYLIVSAVSVTLFAALMNLSAVLAFVGRFIDLIAPVIAGGIFALFINVPMRGIERRPRQIFKNAKKRPPDRWINILSFILTLALAVFVLILVLKLLIPELLRSFQSLYVQIEINIPRWTSYLDGSDTGLYWFRDWLESINWEEWLRDISEGIDMALSGAVGVVSSTVNTAVTAAFALIISVYISLSRERLSRHAKKLIKAYLNPKYAERLLKFCSSFRSSFGNFLTGQCSEAVILGILMALAFTIFRLPYGSLAGMLTAVCAIIPYVGAFVSCIVSVLLVLLIDPWLAIRCLIVYLAVQFIENQFIYPRVVGRSVGLPPLYTLVAAMIGGKLFGIIGIIFFIPLTAVLMEFIKEDAERRLKSLEKELT